MKAYKDEDDFSKFLEEIDQIKEDTTVNMTPTTYAPPEMNKDLTLSTVSKSDKDGTQSTSHNDHKSTNIDLNSGAIGMKDNSQGGTHSSLNKIASAEFHITPPPSSPTPHFYSKEFGKYLKETPYGTMEWLPVVKQWIPFSFPESEDIILNYQNRSYGFSSNSLDQESEDNTNITITYGNEEHEIEGNKVININKRKREELVQRSEKRRKKDVSSIVIMGLPQNFSKEELAKVFSKCGLILKDSNQNPTIKQLEDGSILLTYLRPESVPLAITLFDETTFPNNNMIRVRGATWDEVKSFADPLPQDKNERKLLKRERKRQLSQLKWSLNDEATPIGLQYKTIVIRNLFHEKDVISNPNLKNDIQSTLLKLITTNLLSTQMISDTKRYNPITKIKVYLHHPEGVASVQFRNSRDAERTISFLNNRSICINGEESSRTITAEIWKRRTKELKQEFGTSNDMEDDMERLENFIEESTT